MNYKKMKQLLVTYQETINEQTKEIDSLNDTIKSLNKKIEVFENEAKNNSFPYKQLIDKSLSKQGLRVTKDAGPTYKYEILYLKTLRHNELACIAYTNEHNPRDIRDFNSFNYYNPGDSFFHSGITGVKTKEGIPVYRKESSPRYKKGCSKHEFQEEIEKIINDKTLMVLNEIIKYE